MKRLVSKVLLVLIISTLILLVLSTFMCCYVFTEEWAYVGAYSLITMLVLGLVFAFMNPDIMRM